MADFDGDQLREIMRRVPSPVTVVTYHDNGEPHGVTIGSFTSVSLNPPLVSFNVDRDSTAHAPLAEGAQIVINVLAEGQALLANHFALSDLTPQEQFDPVAIETLIHRIPILEGAAAVLECRIRATHPAGDSTIIVAEVRDGRFNTGTRALLYYDRSYREVGQEREPNLFAPVNRSSSETP